MEIKEDQSNENKQKLFNQSLLYQGGQPPSLPFGRDSKADRGVEKLYNCKKEDFRYALKSVGMGKLEVS